MYCHFCGSGGCCQKQFRGNGCGEDLKVLVAGTMDPEKPRSQQRYYSRVTFSKPCGVDAFPVPVSQRHTNLGSFKSGLARRMREADAAAAHPGQDPGLATSMASLGPLLSRIKHSSYFLGLATRFNIARLYPHHFSCA